MVKIEDLFNQQQQQKYYDIFNIDEFVNPYNYKKLIKEGNYQTLIIPKDFKYLSIDYINRCIEKLNNKQELYIKISNTTVSGSINNIKFPPTTVYIDLENTIFVNGINDNFKNNYKHIDLSNLQSLKYLNMSNTMFETTIYPKYINVELPKNIKYINAYCSSNSLEKIQQKKYSYIYFSNPVRHLHYKNNIEYILIGKRLPFRQTKSFFIDILETDQPLTEDFLKLVNDEINVNHLSRVFS